MKTLSILTECTVDRSKWLRGEGSTASKLLRESDGKMCCLGQFCLQAGLTEDEIIEEVAPWTVRSLGIQTPTQLSPEQESVVMSAMTTNDTKRLTEEKREAELIGIFAQFTPPVKLTFIN